MGLSNEERLAVWERSIETQMHFAELSIKMRQIGLTLAGATVALAIVLYRTNSEFSFDIAPLCISIPAASVLCAAAALILFGAKIIDVGMYHQMLRGAVKFNELYERDLDDLIGWRSGLTESISAHSRHESPELLTDRDDHQNIWTGSTKKPSLAGNKISWFYHVSIAALILAAGFLAVVDNT